MPAGAACMYEGSLCCVVWYVSLDSMSEAHMYACLLLPARYAATESMLAGAACTEPA